MSKLVNFQGETVRDDDLEAWRREEQAIHTHQVAFIAASKTCPQCFRPRTECGGHR
jgi:hypothetical protein